jgi:hypothetical protein
VIYIHHPALPAKGTVERTKPAINAEAKHSLEVIDLRIDDLSKATNNLRNLLAEIKAKKIAQPGPLNRVNDLNNGVFDLWLQIAGYGLGADPYHQNIFASASAFSQVKPPPDYGDSEVSTTMGIPRLYSRYLELTEEPDPSRGQKSKQFLSLVQPYNNPAIYPFRDFYERAYSSYREGKDLDSAQFGEDVTGVESWLSKLATDLSDVRKLVDAR